MQPHAALAQLHTALTLPSRRPHASARHCSLSPCPPPPPLPFFALHNAPTPQQRTLMPLHAALAPLYAALTPSSRLPHVAARRCSLSSGLLPPTPPPPPPLHLVKRHHTTTTPPSRRPHAAARSTRAGPALPSRRCSALTQPPRRT